MSAKQLSAMAISAFLAATAASAQERLEPVQPTIDGNVEGPFISMCVELKDSTPENPLYFSGAAHVTNPYLTEDQLSRTFGGLRSVFETIGHNFTSEQIWDQDPELMRVIRGNLQSLERHSSFANGTVRFGPNDMDNPVITYCPQGVGEPV